MKRFIFLLLIVVVLGGVVYSVNTRNYALEPAKKVIYFTFDADMTPRMQQELQDGKVKEWYSPGLVRYIEEQKLPVTIFSTGMFAELYPSLIKELGALPYISIQNHTYDHASFTPKCYHLRILTSDKEKTAEITATQKILNNLVGYSPMYLRYPGLCHTAHDDELVRAEGLQVADSGIVSGDAFHNNPQRIVQRVLSRLHSDSSQSETIIMHLGGPHAVATEQAVKLLVPQLEKLGYTFAHI